MTQTEVDKWIKRIDGNLILTEENMLYFRHADLFLTNFKEIKYDILSGLHKQLYGVEFFAKEKKSDGVPRFYRRLKANTLNTSLKNNLRFNIPNVRFEVEFKEGVFYDSKQIGGFDFALFDQKYNLINFRNYCFGRRSVHNGEDRWNDEISKREDWREIARSYDLELYEKGIDIPNNKKVPTIVGEVQFGNWALVYYDLLKTIQIEQTFEIDLFIYITAAGNLSKYISAGTVNLDLAKVAIEEFKNIIKFPIWVIGVDFE